MIRFIFLLSLLGTSLCHVYFSESFDNKDAINDWVESTHNGDKQGAFEISAGKKPADPSNLGLRIPTENRFYGLSRKLEEFSTRGKTFVLQYSVKLEKYIGCGGSYVKLLGSGIDQKDFHGESPYKLMFGPDMCGHTTKKVHVIFNYKGENKLIKKDIACKDDQYTHLYTLVVTPDNKYKVLIDNEITSEGSLEDDWDMLLPKKIDDPKAVKPTDWVDESTIIDPEDKKPDDWDQPETILDEDAKKPDDWDDEIDGEWQRPSKPNPDFKGEWQAKKIPNPAYTGPWIPPQIDNPDFVPDEALHALDDVGFIGFDLWRVDADTMFDNILLTDDEEFARKEGERLWKPIQDKEKQLEEEERAKVKETEDVPKEGVDSDDIDEEEPSSEEPSSEEPSSEGEPSDKTADAPKDDSETRDEL